MTPDEFKAARGLLRLSVPRIAERSKVSVSTIRRFERGSRIHDNHHGALRRALEEAGAVIVGAGREVGEWVTEGGVLLVRRPAGGDEVPGADPATEGAA